MGRIANALRSVLMPEQKRREVLALDREFVEMETKVKALQSENLHLQAKVNPLERTIERLEQEIQKKSAPVHKLDPIEVEMMKFIGEKGSVTPSDIAVAMNMHSVPVEHFLSRLLKADYVVQAYLAMIGASYSLADKANAYLVENNLVPLTKPPSAD
jgi:hypothetical protein